MRRVLVLVMGCPDEVEAGFAAMWDRRRRPPQILTSWADAAWAKGRHRYLTFLIRVNEVGVIAKALDVQRRLEAFPCIDLLPIHYFHITVKGVGFLAPSKQHSDDVVATDVDRIIDHATALLKAFSPFEARLTRLNYFSEVICFEVHDANHIRAMNNTLLGVPEIPRMPHDYPRFLPHFSVAQFRTADGFDGVLDFIETHRSTSLGSINLNVVDLVVAHLPHSGRYPWLETIWEFPLG